MSLEAKRTLEAAIRYKLGGIPYDSYGFRKGLFYLQPSQLRIWSNPPIDFSPELPSEEDQKLLLADLEEGLKTDKHPAWKGFRIYNLPRTDGGHSWHPHLLLTLFENQTPEFLHLASKNGRAHFEDVRDFLESDYMPLTQVINSLHGPIPQDVVTRFKYQPVDLSVLNQVDQTPTE